MGHDKADMTIHADAGKESTLKLRWVVGSGQSDVNTLVPVNYNYFPAPSFGTRRLKILRRFL